MLTDFARDHAFTIAWFGLMAMVWFGWAQEDPPQRWRAPLGIGSVLGVALAGLFGAGVVFRWGQESALEGRYGWFGLLVLAEVLAAGIGCLVLARRGRARWMAWWVGLVIALHFLPLALLLQDWSLAVAGVVQTVGLMALRRRVGTDEGVPTSRWVGPWMGATLLMFAVVSAVVFVVRVGAPW